MERGIFALRNKAGSWDVVIRSGRYGMTELHLQTYAFIDQAMDCVDRANYEMVTPDQRRRRRDKAISAGAYGFLS